MQWRDYRAAITPWAVYCGFLGKKAPDLEYWTVGDIFKRGRKALAKKGNRKALQNELLGKAMAAFGTVSMINTKRSE